MGKLGSPNVKGRPVLPDEPHPGRAAQRAMQAVQDMTVTQTELVYLVLYGYDQERHAIWDRLEDAQQDHGGQPHTPVWEQGPSSAFDPRKTWRCTHVFGTRGRIVDGCGFWIEELLLVRRR